eukprot:CAMPEP_0177316628 /NCGR_PEP_ID=MMETSP0368-20130122/13094_1 /TAXON_ID=447022 ORGANISM="Scrippsiella hangoei-like, Strain SHHI-4" /NCGR_SAMPLE_ID=MMETSP0368 /ASSEMBLY_ACC=CAM_ASM_000363 /LENGTH=264 /DNA_ID=CAMNT_0018775907 /DNA_START=1008 /DNA_END=1802 /DNA_ORIENTATION=+
MMRGPKSSGKTLSPLVSMKRCPDSTSGDSASRISASATSRASTSIQGRPVSSCSAGTPRTQDACELPLPSLRRLVLRQHRTDDVRGVGDDGGPPATRDRGLVREEVLGRSLRDRVAVLPDLVSSWLACLVDGGARDQVAEVREDRRDGGSVDQTPHRRSPVDAVDEEAARPQGVLVQRLRGGLPAKVFLRRIPCTAAREGHEDLGGVEHRVCPLKDRYVGALHGHVGGVQGQPPSKIRHGLQEANLAVVVHIAHARPDGVAALQ